MPHPTNPQKKMVISSLTSLHKARTRAMFKLKAVTQEQTYLKSQRQKVLEQLMSLEQKILWEVTNHQKILDGP